MIVDANLLIYATNESARQHETAKRWLAEQLGGDTRVGLPWPSLLAFMRLTTSPRMSASPVSSKVAWAVVCSWLESPVSWIPEATARHVAIFSRLVDKYDVTGNLIPDAHMAAYAIEHGVSIASADTDFARFSEVRWINPVAP